MPRTSPICQSIFGDWGSLLWQANAGLGHDHSPGKGKCINAIIINDERNIFRSTIYKLLQGIFLKNRSERDQSAMETDIHLPFETLIPR